MSDALRQELKNVQRYAKTLRFRRPYNILRSVVGTVLIRLRVDDGAPASPIVRTSAGKGRGSMCGPSVFWLFANSSWKKMNIPHFSFITLQETNISPKNAILKMIFLFPRWDMLIPWRVLIQVPQIPLPLISRQKRRNQGSLWKF